MITGLKLAVLKWRADRAYAAYRAYCAMPAGSGWNARIAFALMARADNLVLDYCNAIRCI